MTALQEEEEPRPVKPTTRKARWLPLLEQELQGRIGWIDEVISPFARAGRAMDAEADLPRAA
jgi:hypothetical protein